VARIRAWAEDRSAGPLRIAAECKRALEGYARAVVDSPTAGRRLSLPSGTLVLTGPKDSLVVDDEPLAAKWLIDNGSAGVRLGVDKTALKAATNPGGYEGDDEGDLLAPVVTTDGEAVPGVHYRRPARSSFSAPSSR
jgi:hypothetical protein